MIVNMYKVTNAEIVVNKILHGSAVIQTEIDGIPVVHTLHN